MALHEDQPSLAGRADRLPDRRAAVGAGRPCLVRLRAQTDLRGRDPTRDWPPGWSVL